MQINLSQNYRIHSQVFTLAKLLIRLGAGLGMCSGRENLALVTDRFVISDAASVNRASGAQVSVSIHVAHYR